VKIVMHSAFKFTIKAVLVLGSSFSLCAAGEELTRDQSDFFENKIRPLFVAECYKCHSQQATKLKGGLSLESRDGWAAGGDTGVEFAHLAQAVHRELPNAFVLIDATERTALQVEQIERDAFRLRDFESEAMKRLIFRSAELHLNHIATSGDPFEFGSARPLDFGHWAAHKLEQISEYRIRHGEAVAIGIALDLAYSVRKGFLDRASADRIVKVLETIGFHLWDDALEQRERDGAHTLIAGLREFREHLGGELHITLLHGIGDSFEVTEMDEVFVSSAIEDLETRSVQDNVRVTPTAKFGRR
jgi:hypothetical protein